MSHCLRCMRRQTPQLQQRWIGCPLRARRARRARRPSLHRCSRLMLRHRPVPRAQRRCLLQMLHPRQLPRPMHWRPHQKLRLCHLHWQRPQPRCPCLPRLQASLLLQRQLKGPHHPTQLLQRALTWQLHRRLPKQTQRRLRLHRLLAPGSTCAPASATPAEAPPMHRVQQRVLQWHPRL